MKKKISVISIIYVILLILPFIGFAYIYTWYNKEKEKIENACFVHISKQEMLLRVFDYKGNELVKYPIACGKNYGDKEKVGDMKTPEGVFYVSDIHDSSNWSHDFKDGKGEIKGAYGPYFIRLNVPNHTGIGIHGTHDSNSLGSRATEGCIRLENKNVEHLKSIINYGTVVIVTPSVSDIENTLTF